MQLRRRGLIAALLLLGICPLLGAANITYTITGTLGPILSGSDPLGANGETGTVTAVVSQSLHPTSTTATSATYTLPQGAISVIIGGTTYGTQGPATLIYNFPASGPATLVCSAKVSVDGLTGTVTLTASLAHGSIPSSVTSHPAKFKPSPQTLKAATKAGGAGSQVKYSVPLLGTTVLGLAGTASN